MEGVNVASAVRSTQVRKLSPLLAVALIVSACGGDETPEPASTGQETSQGELTPIAIGTTPSVNTAALRIGIEQGIFEDHGLDVELEAHQNTSASIALLINGQRQFATGGPASVITAVAAGVGLKITSGLVAVDPTEDLPQTATVASEDSGITSFADLEDKTVGVLGLGSQNHVWTYKAVESAGGDAESIDFVEIPPPNQMSSLRDGTVDAVTAFQPFLTQGLLQGDLRLLGDPGAELFGEQERGYLNVFMSAEYAQDNPDVVSSFVAALEEASSYANENPDAYEEAVGVETELEPDMIAELPQPIYTADVDSEGIENEIELLVDFGEISADSRPTLDDLIFDPAE